MQCELRNPMMLFILLCDVGNINMHLMYKHFTLTRIQKNEMLYKSAISHKSAIAG